MKRILIALCTLFFAATAMAQEAPDALVKRVTDQVIDILHKDRSIHAGNVGKATTVVESLVAPHFNFRRLTARAVGKDWDTASADQQERLVQNFRTLLVRTFANLLVSYDDEKIRHHAAAPEGTAARVRMDVVDPGNEVVYIDVSLELLDGAWKVHNVEVGGIGLVSTYREQFAQVVKQSGIEGLIDAIARKNRATAQR